MKDNWQDNLRSDFDVYTESAPDGLWDEVQSGLARVRRRRRTIALTSGISAFAFALATVLLLSGPVADYDIIQDGRAVLCEASIAGLPKPELPKPAALLGRHLRPVSVRTPESTPDTAAYASSGQAVLEMARDVEKTAGTVSLADEPDFFSEEPVATQSHTRKAVSIGLSASGMAGSSSSGQGYGTLSQLNSSAVLSRRNQDGVFQTRSSASEDDFVISGNSSEFYSDIRHYQPLRLDLIVSREIAGGFFFSGGLSWSMLVSDMSSGSSSVRYDSRQTLHYLGIPLSVGMSFPLSERLEVSLSAGGAVAKCIYGTVRTDCVISDVSREVESQRVSITPLQWSAQVSASLGWKFSPAFGMFLKPGLAYYFNDGSTVPTIYKDRPLNFDLALGLRLYLK